MFLVVPSIKFFKIMDTLVKVLFAVTHNKFYLGLNIYMLQIPSIGVSICLYLLFSYIRNNNHQMSAS